MSDQLIGGMFGLTKLSNSNKQFPPFLKNKEIFLTNARSGINILAALLKPKKIWMPSFLCDVMLKAVQNIEVQFYEVDHYLKISEEWLNAIQKDELVVFIDYFGFPFDSSLAKRVQERGGWVLEDASQALLSSEAGINSDFVLFSPRKFLGVPDGGILRNNTNINFSEIQLVSPPADWWSSAFEATILRRDFDLHRKEMNWFQLFQETDKNSPIGFYAMSEFSRTLLEYSFDYQTIIRKRIENYQVLHEYLGRFALFSELPVNVVPLGYPIHLNNRNHVRQVLFENNIYPPIHWPINGIVPEKFVESHYLANVILTLVCDQRYSQIDMQRMAKIVLREA